MLDLIHFLCPQPIFADVVSIVYYVIEAIIVAVSYVGYEKAKKAAKNAMERARGLLYQSRATTKPRRILYGRRRLGGLEVYVQASGEKNAFLNYVLLWCDGPCEEVEKILFDGVALSISYDMDGIGTAGGRYNGLVKVKHRLGGSDNDDAVTDMSFPNWGATDLLLGICYSLVRLTYDDGVFASGVPGISAVVKGKNDVRDPRDDTFGYTENPILCLNDYLTLSRLGPGIDYSTRVSIDEFIDAANVCDEDVALSIGGFQKRYTFNDVLTLDMDPEAIIEVFRTAFAGIAVYIGGKWRYYAGAYITPTLRITKDDLVAPINEQTKVSKKGHVNTVKGGYVAECNSWQPTSFPAFTKAAYLTDDKEELLESVDYTCKNNVMECRRMASIELMRQRLSRSANIICNVRALRAQPGLPIIFHFPEIGYEEQPMMVLEMGGSIGQDIAISLSIREYGPQIFEWNPADDAYATAYCPDMTAYLPPLPPPGTPGGPPNTYPNRHPEIIESLAQGNLNVGCKVQGGTFHLYGFPEEMSPSSPPDYYLRKTFSGDSLYKSGANDDTGCVGCAFGNTAARYSGYNTIDPVTGVETYGAAIDYGSNTGTCAPNYGDFHASPVENLGDGYPGSAYGNQLNPIAVSRTEVRAQVVPCYNVFSSWHTLVYPGQIMKTVLSDKNSDAEAIPRIESGFADWDTVSATPLGSCLARYDLRTGRNLTYSKARIYATGSGYFPLWTYALKFDIMRRASPSSDPFLNVGVFSMELTADTSGNFDQHADIPNEIGFETYLDNPTLEA